MTVCKYIHIIREIHISFLSKHQHLQVVFSRELCKNKKKLAEGPPGIQTINNQKGQFNRWKMQVLIQLTQMPCWRVQWHMIDETKEFEPRTFWFPAQVFKHHNRGTLLRKNAKQGCWNTITGVTVCYTTAPSSLSLPPSLSLFPSYFIFTSLS